LILKLFRKITSPFIIIFLLLSSCHPTHEEKALEHKKAMIPVRLFYPDFGDDMDDDSMIRSLKRNMEYFKKKKADYRFQYGPDFFTNQQIIDTQRYFLQLLRTIENGAERARHIRKHFKLYRARGKGWHRRVLFTGYFEPIFEGSLTPDEIYKYPLYRRPKNLIKIDLSQFNEKYEGQSITARIDGQNVLPYFTRRQIDVEKALSGKGLELAWLKDPLDVAFLQIQGSGRIKLPDGKMILVGYHISNGRPYHSIGKYMMDNDLLSKEQMSMQGIRQYLTNNPHLIQEVLSHNPAYVFFRKLEEGPLGNIGVPLTPGRSLALDSRLFPKGALCFITTQKPVLNQEGEIKEWVTFSRFMVNQDTGGAIKGTGRADIFWGSGPYAETAAGYMQHEGRLYMLIKKP
jgi:membrane-bound lytic murein transglycosylase A